MVIEWTEFDWQSFATLATGLMAFLVAIILGSRQLTIIRRQSDLMDAQTAILGRQAQLEELALRADLFDKRYAVYAQTRDYLLHIIHHAEVAEGELRNKFISAMNESRFVFRPEVYESLNEIWRVAGELHVLKEDMKVSYNEHGHYGDGNPAKEAELFKRVANYLRDITDIFEEMKLGGHLLGGERLAAPAVNA